MATKADQRKWHHAYLGPGRAALVNHIKGSGNGLAVLLSSFSTRQDNELELCLLSKNAQPMQPIMPSKMLSYSGQLVIFFRGIVYSHRTCGCVNKNWSKSRNKTKQNRNKNQPLSEVHLFWIFAQTVKHFMHFKPHLASFHPSPSPF